MTIPGTSPQAFPSLNKYCTQGGGQGKQAAACSMGGGWVQVLHLFSMVGMVAVILTDMAQLTVGQGMLEMCRDVSTPECHLANGACVPMGRQDDDVAIIDLFDCLDSFHHPLCHSICALAIIAWPLGPLATLIFCVDVLVVLMGGLQLKGLPKVPLPQIVIKVNLITSNANLVCNVGRSFYRPGEWGCNELDWCLGQLLKHQLELQTSVLSLLNTLCRQSILGLNTVLQGGHDDVLLVGETVAVPEENVGVLHALVREFNDFHGHASDAPDALGGTCSRGYPSSFGGAG
mmetsp:Transcript_28693/g.77351  ORF Transcript_28693/g.77351 Transcript_28693/m.77351 type:complete len:289 (-) Transcript_28693:70-936(-)